jgi:Protein of unknown function (DUF4240)
MKRFIKTYLKLVFICVFVLLNGCWITVNNKKMEIKSFDDEFWDIIEKSKSYDLNDNLQNLINELSQLPDDKIYNFEFILTEKIKNLHSWNSYAVCSIIEIAFSDEDFLDFKCWVISQGKDFYNTFLIDPEKLSSKIEQEVKKNILLRFEELLYAADFAMKLKYKHSDKKYILPRDYTFKAGSVYGISNQLSGLTLNSDELIRSRFPKIFAAVKGILRNH